MLDTGGLGSGLQTIVGEVGRKRKVRGKKVWEWVTFQGGGAEHKDVGTDCTC